MNIEERSRVERQRGFGDGRSSLWMREKELGFQYERRSLGLGRLTILRFGSSGRGIPRQEQGVSIPGVARQHRALSGCFEADALINRFVLLAGRFRRMRRKDSAHAGGSQAQDDCRTDQNFENPMIHARHLLRNNNDDVVFISIRPKKGKRFFNLWCLLSAVPPVR